jgi:DNA-binding beta-propeller fold protein YncE
MLSTTIRIGFAASLGLIGLLRCHVAKAADPALRLDAKIELSAALGRIDHMAIDLPRQRLFVAELGNDSVGVIDLKEQKTIRTLTGMNEPQGIGYSSFVDTLYVANAGDGSVRLYQGAEYSPVAQVDLGSDADNVRIDLDANRIFVGYGSGGLAVIDPAKRSKIGDIRLKAHPESFQLDRESSRIFVNVPNAREIAVVDRDVGKQTVSWPMQIGSYNFPMALDGDAKQVLTVFRSPPLLATYALADGKLVKSLATCGDSDDLFVDAKRSRVYVICGGGYIDAFDTRQDPYQRIAHILTVTGARTALFAPELDRLFVAVRAGSGEQAAIWVFRPLP